MSGGVVRRHQGATHGGMVRGRTLFVGHGGGGLTGRRGPLRHGRLDDLAGTVGRLAVLLDCRRDRVPVGRLAVHLDCRRDRVAPERGDVIRRWSSAVRAGRQLFQRGRILTR